MSSEKILMIRFSAIGDIVQCLSVAAKLKEKFPDAEIHWVTREDMKGLMAHHPALTHVWTFDRKSGFSNLLKLAFQLRKARFSRIYDAHNNLRSIFICTILSPLGWGPEVLRRSIKRWERFLLFRFRINKFEQPFSGQRDLIEPLQRWGITKTLPPTPQFFINEPSSIKADELIQNHRPFIALAPSAAYFLKRWPKESFIELTQLLPDYKFICLGGPDDAFIHDIAKVDPSRILNLTGKCSLGVSAAVIQRAELLVANDTGLMHIGEQLGKPVIALMGPAPFGFPSRTPKTLILERNLSCRPCSKHGQGPCINKIYHQCMLDIKPAEVAAHIRRILA